MSGTVALSWMASIWSFLFPTTFELLSSLLYPSINKKKHQSSSLIDRPTGLPSSKCLVSIVHCGDAGSSSSVAVHLLDDDVKEPQPIPAAVDYKFFACLDEPVVGDQRLLKVVRKGTSSIEKLCRFLRRDDASSQVDYTAVTLPQSAFLSGRQEAKSTDATEVYAKIRLRYANGFASTQYFNARSSAIKTAHLTTPTENIQSIDINSGICLFSTASVASSDGCESSGLEGKPQIPAVPHNVNLTLYELETMTRLASAICDTVGLVQHLRSRHDTPIRINIDIPDFQYYWTACEFVERGLAPVSYVEGWIAAVDERRTQLGSIVTSLISTMLKSRALRPVDVQMTSGTEPATALVKERIDAGTMPCLDEVVVALKTQGQDAAQWADFLDNLEPRQVPSSLKDLGRLIYVFKAVKPGLRQSHTGDANAEKSHGQRVVIQIDDINEWKILDQATKFLKKYAKGLSKNQAEPIILGLFPMQKTFVAGPGRSDLYYKDPGPRLRLQSDKSAIRPLDIIGMTYGPRVRDDLRRACIKGGLFDN